MGRHRLLTSPWQGAIVFYALVQENFFTDVAPGHPWWSCTLRLWTHTVLASKEAS